MIISYKKSILLFSTILLFISICFLLFFDYKLNQYEKNDLDNYLSYVLEDLKESAKDNKLDKYVEDKNIENDYENNKSLLEEYTNFLKTSKLSYLRIDNNVYEIKSNNHKIATLTLKESKEKSVLGLLNYVDYDVLSFVPDELEGLYNIEIYSLSDNKIYINGKEILNENLIDSKEINEFIEGYNYSNIPKINHYLIKGLISKPKIKIVNSLNNEINYKEKDNIIYADSPLILDNIDEARKYLKNSFDPLLFAEKWSLYLTGDLYGRNGFYQLKNNLIENTNMYQRAYNWSKNYDINFTSPHTLDSNIFTNEKLYNIKIYNSDTFSVDINLDKNIILKNGEKRVDSLKEHFYYIYNDGEYKLINMKTIEG